MTETLEQRLQKHCRDTYPGIPDDTDTGSPGVGGGWRDRLRADSRDDCRERSAGSDGEPLSTLRPGAAERQTILSITHCHLHRQDQQVWICI